MVLASKVLPHSLLTHSREVKPGFNKAFADVQWGLRPTEDIGFYKSRSGGSVSWPIPSLISPGAALENNEDGLIQTKSEAERLAPGDYKDLIAKSGSTQQPQRSCGTWAVISECESGEHHFGKKIFCGREWCEVCGEDNSASHKRRQARLLPRIQQVKELGYFVIEFPDSVREVAGLCYSKTGLRDTTKAIVEVMAGKRGVGGDGRKRKGGYFPRGNGRWHFFGDELPGKWNPHFNVLVDSAYLEPAHLEKIKASLRAALNCPDLIVHYSYFDKPGQMVQKVRYVTKATFRNYDWNPYMARELFKFRNIRWWGSWSESPAWEIHEAQDQGEDIAGLALVASLQKGVCPDCGRPLRALHYNRTTGVGVVWSMPVDSVYLKLWGAREVAGTGYYRIPPGEWRGHSLSPGEFLKLEEKEARARDLTGPVVTLPAKLARKRVNDYWERKRRAWTYRENLVKTGQLSKEFDNE